MFVPVCLARAQDGQPSQVTNEPSRKVLNVFIDRVGFLGGLNYGYLEWFQQRETSHPKWAILGPDVGFIFFGDIGRYRETYIGAGFEVKPTAALTIDNEADFDQATGPGAHGKTWYQPWTRVLYRFPKQLVSEVVVIPYVPLNGGTTQFLLERSSLQYTGFRRFNIGAGYGAYRDFTYTNWLNKPYATVTWKSPSWGDFEVWFQALPHNGFQLQYRHVIAWHTRY